LQEALLLKKTKHGSIFEFLVPVPEVQTSGRSVDEVNKIWRSVESVRSSTRSNSRKSKSSTRRNSRSSSSSPLIPIDTKHFGKDFYYG
jgi:hypothetical protein